MQHSKVTALGGQAAAQAATAEAGGSKRIPEQWHDCCFPTIFAHDGPSRQGGGQCLRARKCICLQEAGLV